ncbi:hypothetical protein EIN_086070 [Entamoeba invadens IP1]|uniref:hypothetical protein n=1 Tax=Entamoeba invadens IP1 TaxID=370355 RepID=UPI0002C3DC56|nr:hypothetical protein EIN_086070 [Entamoeba invadens IP1]ELP85355.1 hypothetical protein EIN_086070 [Entamoeba invadens IP1]|eukprot:XP_004184701.1 hypothetical protein EIN_086070 [Entamoeba invadens IP1]
MNILDRDYEWTKKTVCKAIFSTKTILSLIIGITIGVIGVQGWLGFAIFFGTTGLISVLFVLYYHLDELEREVTYGDAFNEGLGAALSAFLLMWIVTFTFVHS